MSTKQKRIDVPPGFRLMEIGEACTESRLAVEPDAPNAPSLPYLGLEHVEAGTGHILEPPERLLRPSVRSLTFYFEEGHVLYGKLRPYLNKVALPNFQGRCSTELIPLKPTPGILPEYLAFSLRKPEVVAAAMSSKVGARMPRANLREVFRTKALVPEDMLVQERIVATFRQRLEQVARARQLCEDQLRTIELLQEKYLRSFPLEASNGKKA